MLNSPGEGWGFRMHRFLLSLLAVTCFTYSPALHAEIVYTANLNGANEVPPTNSTATGFAALTLVGDLLKVDLTFLGLIAPASAAHIHCCTPPGMNAIIAIPFP